MDNTKIIIEVDGGDKITLAEFIEINDDLDQEVIDDIKALKPGESKTFAAFVGCTYRVKMIQS